MSLTPQQIQDGVSRLMACIDDEAQHSTTVYHGTFLGVLHDFQDSQAVKLTQAERDALFFSCMEVVRNPDENYRITIAFVDAIRAALEPSSFITS